MNAAIANNRPVNSSSRQRNRAAARAARTSAARLSGYLAAGVSAGIVGTAPVDAGIVNIDIGPSGFNIGGINAGVAAGSDTTANNFPTTNAGILVLSNGYFSYWGLGPGAYLALAASASDASPTRFTVGQTVSGSEAFQFQSAYTAFRARSSVSPDFGAGSYMGFRTAQNNYGWLEVTWNATADQFQILSGAYESDANTPIPIGAVPEPTTIALTGVASLALGAGAIRRARKARQGAAKAV
jgi:hypothetical protein